MREPGALEIKTFAFALDILDFEAKLLLGKHYTMANQLFRCGTGIGANVREAQEAESKADFIHKLKIANKEAEETDYFIKLCAESPHCPHPEKLTEKIQEILRLLNAIIATAKHNLKQRYP